MVRELAAYSTGSLLVQAQKRAHLQPEWHLRPALAHLHLVHFVIRKPPCAQQLSPCAAFAQSRYARALGFSPPAEHRQTVRRPDSVNYADGAATCEKGGRVVAGYLQQMAEDYQDKFN